MYDYPLSIVLLIYLLISASFTLQFHMSTLVLFNNYRDFHFIKFRSFHFTKLYPQNIDKSYLNINSENLSLCHILDHIYLGWVGGCCRVWVVISTFTSLKIWLIVPFSKVLFVWSRHHCTWMAATFKHFVRRIWHLSREGSFHGTLAVTQ